MKDFTELNNRVIEWAKSKEILSKATPLAQINKTLEEVLETKEAIFADWQGLDDYFNIKNELKDTKEEILDGFGDILVTVLIGCKMQNIDPLHALETALNAIEKRTGKMVDGQFVKDE